MSPSLSRLVLALSSASCLMLVGCLTAPAEPDMAAMRRMRSSFIKKL